MLFAGDAILVAVKPSVPAHRGQVEPRAAPEVGHWVAARCPVVRAQLADPVVVAVVQCLAVLRPGWPYGAGLNGGQSGLQEVCRTVEARLRALGVDFQRAYVRPSIAYACPSSSTLTAAIAFSSKHCFKAVSSSGSAAPSDADS